MIPTDNLSAVPVQDRSEEALELRTANGRLRALIDIAMELASERDPDKLLHSVCVAARDLFDASYVTLGIVDLNERTVRQVVTCGSARAPESADWVKIGDSVSGILGTVLAEGRAMRGGNSGGDPAGVRPPSLHPNVQAFLAAPMASPARVFGWFCLVGNEGRVFTEDDEHLVTALSGQVGRIYENAHFYAVSQKRTEQLEHEALGRKQVETALRHERDRAKRYLDTAEVCLVKLDLEGRIVLVNRYACSVLGWTAEELVGQRWVDKCLPARIRDAAGESLLRLLGGDASTIENVILTKSGEERLIEWRNTLLRDDEGRITGTFSSGTDMTERHQAVEALRTAEERMRFALEAAGVGIWDLDYTTGELRWSETVETFYGLQPGTFPGTFDAFIERVHPEDRESVLATMANAIENRADFSTQHRSTWPDGTVRWLTSSGRIHLGEHGKVVRVVGISQDVTERRALGEQYRQALKMEAVGRLASGVAHDFNNLLTGILGHCELLLADLNCDDPRQADIAAIQKAGQSAAGLTRQLLAFSRKQIVEPTLLDLNVIVADMRAMLKRLIGEDVNVVLELRPEMAPVKADRTQLEQIVLNLALNARDAMPSGGTLTIETAVIELDANDSKNHFTGRPGLYVALRVTDTGTGMTPQVQAHLFEPFFTTKPHGQGTGLGLATVQDIVTRSGGSITVDTEVARGTSVKVYFPMADSAGVVAEPRLRASRRSGSETVLVVEDAAGLRHLARRLLQRQGYEVLTAANADDAVRLFEDNPSIDLLLTDVVMPGTSGPELARRLMEWRPALKVIYMSGYTDDAIVQHGVLNHGVAFIHKPFTSDTLGHKIRETLDR
jgi:PAS domain S-box-containing protein